MLILYSIPSCQALALSVLLLSWIIGWSRRPSRARVGELIVLHSFRGTSWCTSAGLAGLALLAAFLERLARLLQ